MRGVDNDMMRKACDEISHVSPSKKEQYLLGASTMTWQNQTDERQWHLVGFEKAKINFKHFQKFLSF